MNKLVAIATAFLASLLVLGGITLILPDQSNADANKQYGYLCSGVKSESVDFTLDAVRDDSYFLFGSSELSTLPQVVSSAPDNVMQQYDCGMQFMYIGEGYDQSLWIAIAAGAYAEGMPNKKIGIIVSPQWFFDSGLESGIFKMRFSYSLYKEFCANPNISAETRAYVEERLISEGVDRALVDAGDPDYPQDYLNDAVFSTMNDLRLRDSLQDVRGYGSPVLPEPTVLPDFNALREQAVIEAQAFTSNNEYGVFNDYWADIIAPEFAARKNALAHETLNNATEYEDLSCFLDVCEEAGLEPCVIVMPVNGMWYDYAGLSKEVRDSLYDRIASLCSERKVELLDLASHEYEKYYMRDIMHLGWLGWIDVEEGFMRFVKEES